MSKFIDTSKGQITMLLARKAKVKVFSVECEPKSKRSITDTEKRSFRLDIINQLKSNKWRKYRKSLVLKIDFFVTAQNPPSVKELVKNYLDLLHKPLSVDKYKNILFDDDSQIKVLVARVWTSKKPKILIRSSSYNDFLQDIRLVKRIEENDFEDRDEIEKYELEELYDHQEEYLLDDLIDYNKNKGYYVNELGEKVYNTMLTTALLLYQNKILSKAKITPVEIISLFIDSMKSAGNSYKNESWETIYELLKKAMFLRLNFVDLEKYPQKEGDSEAIKSGLREKLEEFKVKYAPLFPLKVPIKISIYFSQPQVISQKIDPDNLARKYIIPLILSILQPPSEFDLYNTLKSGISIDCYEVVEVPRSRLTPLEGHIGVFISLGSMFSDILTVIDDYIDGWQDQF